MRYRQSNWAALAGLLERRVPKQVLVSIRDAMLVALGECSPTRHFLLDMEITFAEDIDQLWNLRMELFEAIRSTQGESIARERIDGVTQKFVGFHPAAKAPARRFQPSGARAH